MRRISSAAVCGLALLAASCVSVPEAPAPSPPAPPPAPVVQAPPPAPVAADWTERPATPGDWRYLNAAGGTAAQFAADGAALFEIRCERAARRIRFARPGVLDPGRTARMTLSASTASATYALANAGGAPAMVAASTGAADGFLDALVYTRGRFLVRADGAPDLVLPAWAEVHRVVEDCRG